MASLDEIRKRFAKVNMAEEGAANGSISAGNGTPNVGTSALKKFEVQISEITRIAEPLERVLNQTARAIDEIKVFTVDMERLAKAYDGIRTFQTALNAEAARELRHQFDGIERTFYENLSTAAALLDPAREFQARISELAKIFDGLKPLQEKLQGLAKDFKPQPVESKSTIVLDQRSTPSGAENMAANAAVSGQGR
jgi:flagellin-specific chaperone FliS